MPGTPDPAARRHAPSIPPPPVPAPFPPEPIRAQCEALIARYPERVAALIPILHLAQKLCGGWISPELEAGIAK
jgi:NADH:ubiquinone oxidoreductase subunit E